MLFRSFLYLYLASSATLAFAETPMETPKPEITSIQAGRDLLTALDKKFVDKSVANTEYHRARNNILLSMHALRLTADIAYYEERLKHPATQDWITESNRTKLRMKQDALYHVNEAKNALSWKNEVAVLETMAQVEAFVGTNAASRNRDIESETDVGDLLKGRALRGYPKLNHNFYGKNSIDIELRHEQSKFASVGEALLDFTDLETHELSDDISLLKKAALGRTSRADDMFGGLFGRDRRFAEILKRLSDKTYQDIYSHPEILNPTFAVAVAKFYESITALEAERRHAQLRPTNAKTNIPAIDAFLNPLREHFSKNGKANPPEGISLIAMQNSLLSEEDLAKTPEEREEDLHQAINAALKVYHSETYQKNRAATYHKQTPEEDILDLKWRSILSDDDSPANKRASDEGFPRMTLQGKTNACVAFTVVHAMEAFEGVPELSKDVAYSLTLMTESEGAKVFDNPQDYFKDAARQEIENEIKAIESMPILKEDIEQVREFLTKKLESIDSSDSEELYKIIDRGASFKGTFQAVNLGLPASLGKPFETRFLPMTLNHIEGRNFKTTGFAKQNGSISQKALQVLLDRGVRPMVSISDANRSIEEEWIRPEPTSQIGHALIITDYGRAVDPFDLREKDFFEVRDSFTDHPIHYRVSAEELLPLIQQIARVKGVERLENPVTFERFQKKP